MSDKVFLGAKAGKLETGEKLSPVSRVNVSVDSGNIYTSGDDTGRTVEVPIPWGTQAMADHILDGIKNAEYLPYTAQQALLDPAAEIGDGITVGGIYSAIYQTEISFDRQMAVTVSAPKSDEVEDEYPYQSKARRAANRQLAQTRSTISKTADQLRLEVSNDLEGLSAAIEIDLTEIIGRVEDAESGLSQTVRLSADGLTITNASGDTLEIDGGQLKANSIDADALKANSITADKLSITGSISFQDLDSSTQSTIKNASTTASSAYGIAASANSNASSALNNLALLANGQYQGGTFIDGKNLYAPNLYGDTINLMDGSSYLVGSISLIPSATWAMDISSNLSLRMSAAGNVYMTNGSAWLQMMGSNLTLSGNVIVSYHNFGTALPSYGTYGQVFFLLGG